MRVSCLHTAAMEIPIFEAACPPGISLAHHVRSDLFYRARNGLDAGIATETTVQLRKLEAGSDAVLLTCSVLGIAASPPAWCADALLAEVADREAAGQALEVLYTCPMATDSVDRHFRSLTAPTDLRITMIPEAWGLVTSGRIDEHNDLIRDAVNKSDADVVALVQASMIPAAVEDTRVLNVAKAGLMRLDELLQDSRLAL